MINSEQARPALVSTDQKIRLNVFRNMLTPMITKTHVALTLLLASISIPNLCYAEPLTLKTDSFKLRPQLWLSGDYDDNVFYESEQEPTGNLPNFGAVLKVGGGLKLQNRDRSGVAFNLDASSAYRHYVYLGDENGRAESELETLRQGRNGIDFARLNGQLILGNQSDVQLILNDRFNYIERPAFEGTTFGFERVDNILGTAVDFSPGRRNGGGPLGLKLGYELRSIFFLNEGDGLLIQQRSEKNAHTFSLASRWRFLPKNFLTFDVSYTSNNYNDLAGGEGDEDPELLSRDSTPLRMELGLSGLITTRFSVYLKGGYSNTYNRNGSSYEGFIGLFQFSYIYTPVTEVSIGYQRDGQDSGFSNFYTLDRIYAKSSFNLSNRLTLNANISYDIYEYNAANAIDNASRTDPVIRSQVALLTKLTGQFSLQIAYSIEANYTDYELPVNDPIDFASYQRQLFTLALYFN